MKFNLILILIVYAFFSFGQTHKNVTITQAPALQVHAGDDKTIAPNQSITLGGTPTASFGSPGYTYLWQPATGLNSFTAANPLASPSNTTTYVVFVTDSKGCTSTDTVKVVVNASSIDEVFSAEDINILFDPIKKSINISFDACTDITNGRVSIYNLLGQEITGKNIARINNRTPLLFDFSNFAKGVYILKVSGQGLGLSKKFSVN